MGCRLFMHLTSDKKKLIYLSIILFLGILVIIGLTALMNGRLRSSNAFIRVFPPHVITAGQAIDLKFNSYYLAGASGPYLYLGNFTNPRVLLRLKLSLTDSETISIKIPDGFQFHTDDMVEIDSPFIFLKDNSTAHIYRGSLNTFLVDTAYSLILDDFSIGHALSNSSFVIRKYDDRQKQNILKKISIGIDPTLNKQGILVKQLDGVFCTEGSLNYSKKAGLLIYTYMFRNQFIVMDSSLNILYYGKTIDTNSIVKIRVTSLEYGKVSQISAPPLLVNQKSAMNQHYLFVQSALKANNEPDSIFSAFWVFDIYDLKNGIYKFSFYLSKQKTRHLTSIAVYNNRLYTIQDQYLYSFSINF